MILIIGLGNLGKKYKFTRHNIGFMVVDEFRKQNNFLEFRFSKKFNSQISKGYLENKKIILAKPQTFMNLSGQAVKSFTKTYHLKPNNLIIIHDDIDLPLGKIRISKDRGSAGHKGVESIIKALNSKDFSRLRIGILPESGKPLKQSRFQRDATPVVEQSSLRGTAGQAKNVENFVLQKFNKKEEAIVKGIVQKSCLAIEEILKEGLEKAIGKFN